ncbi:MAG: DUF2147 domain-containing protein [Zoogloea sp.]|nr:DUF2147 domain-containing protein [Zoogloea sp.]
MPFLKPAPALLMLALLVGQGAAGAAARDTIVGLWMVIDDRNGTPRALVRIAEHEGEYRGTVEKGLRADDRRHPVCERCEGPRRGQPLLGMTILTGLKKDGGEYRGGEILDPENGRVYRCRMTLLDQGERLEVRGFIGVPALGRSQTWQRVTE